ncbi:MAG TPA: prolipoprotein diacylglyceryl transferase family protein [Trebonia sp.]|nr:prolipoprotein diacylglyceryl transferase family protein [Trebonia sp.]
MPQAKKRKAARPSGSGASGRPAAPSRDVPPGAAPENLPPDPAPAAVPPGLARRPANGTTRQSATSTATVPATKRPPLDMRPALPGIGSATAKTVSAKGAGARAGDATAAEAKAAGAAADSGADDEVPRWAAQALEQLLHVTCWLDPGEDGEQLTATVRFTGQRTDVTGKPGPGDTFTQEETYQGIVPGSGPVAVTAEVRGVNPGTWSVTARPVSRAVAGQPRPGAAPEPAAAGRVPWPRRVTVQARPNTSVHTASTLRSKVPGVIRYAYACLVVLGVLTGLAIEGVLLAAGHYPVLRPELLSVAAVAAGVIGGKAWYAAVSGGKWDGWCIQGFVGGAAVVVAVVAVVGPGVPKGAFLAAATPALLIGMGIGRHACFWAGCCTGRPTASRWGIWSSDRRLGCRRMPVQLYEAWTALVVGAATLGVILALGLPRSGAVGVIALAAYTLVRQGILSFRDEPRHWRYGRAVTASLAAAALIAGVVVLVVA